MTTKTSDWQPGPTVCRCCLTEGCYKDISTEYFWMGKREVYAELLNDTLNISIAYAKAGPNSNSRLICEPCISRLRDAHDFRRQVLECEKTFMQYLDPGSSGLQSATLTLEEVKVEQVKQEKKLSDDEDFDDRVDFVVNDDTDDDLDDEPLMKLATKVPKKEKEVDLLDLLDSTQITVKRKSTASSSKAKEPAAKKAKKREIVIKPSASKTASKAVAKVGEKKKKENSSMSMARENAYTIVEYSTAYPFRLPESAIMCVYCCESYQEPESFRRHMQAEHREYKPRHAFAHINCGYLKVDITDLRCRTCNEACSNLEDIANHLKNAHNRRINTEYEFGLLPFRMERDKLSCPICEDRSANMRGLSRHVQGHFFQCICEHCGKAYSSNTSLVNHVRYSCAKSGEKQRLCRKCKTVITSLEEHLKTSELCRQHICGVCGERFGYWKEKQTHMEAAHGVPKRVYRCPECDMVFKSAGNLTAHFKISHTEDYLICGHCGMKFDNRHKLDRHMLTHTGEKAFVCNVCSKRFPRKSTLNQHMWIHSEVKRHECKLCDRTFNQKVCWKTHMKMRHPELYDPTC